MYAERSLPPIHSHSWVIATADPTASRNDTERSLCRSWGQVGFSRGCKTLTLAIKRMAESFRGTKVNYAVATNTLTNSNL
jgi:hypothetical protein